MPATLAVLDTHALIWAASGQQRLLGRRAKRFINSVEQGQAAAYVATISLVEVGEAVRRGALSLEGEYESWVSRLAKSGRYHIVDLTLAIAIRAHELYEIPERGDRLVAATALELDCPLVTRDSAVAQAPGVDALW